MIVLGIALFLSALIMLLSVLTNVASVSGEYTDESTMARVVAAITGMFIAIVCGVAGLAVLAA